MTCLVPLYNSTQWKIFTWIANAACPGGARGWWYTGNYEEPGVGAATTGRRRPRLAALGRWCPRPRMVPTKKHKPEQSYTNKLTKCVPRSSGQAGQNKEQIDNSAAERGGVEA